MLARTRYFAGSPTSSGLYFSDGNGNITYMLATNQTMLASYRYDPSGNIISQSGSQADVNVYRFSSKEVHVNSGMYYYGFRFYDPNLQRWINRDPIAGAGGLNLYSMAGNDCIGSLDPFGWSDFNAPPSCASAQWHHPIPWNNSTYNFDQHELVKGAGWTKNDLKYKQNSDLLDNHAGRHSESYLDEVQGQGT
jgi:RHS repeat-associated protein